MTAVRVRLAPVEVSRAVFSPCRRWRYTLTRVWEPHDDDPLSCLFVCLNPSTADEKNDDPTVRRCIAFARSWGYSSLTVCNIFALRSTDPKALYVDLWDAVGAANDEHIAREAARHELVVAAWGNHGQLTRRGVQVMKLLRRHAPDGVVHVLGLNSTLEPKHPLYIAGDTKPRQLWP